MLKSKALNPKKVVLISLLCVICMSILASIIYPIIMNMITLNKKHDRITTSYDNEEQFWSDWHYNGVKYSFAPGLRLNYTTPARECTEENGFYLISWYWHIIFLQKFEIFGDSPENPHYLYCPYMGIRFHVHVSENFDYMDEEYIICNQEYIEYERMRTDTEFSFKLKDVYYIDEPFKREYETESIADFSSRSKSFERLEFYGEVYLINEEYYICFRTGSYASEQTFKAKPEFIELLKKADILNSDS